MKPFEHKVWCVNATGTISRLAGFNNEETARKYREETSKAHPSGTILLTVTGSEITSSSVGSSGLK